MSEKPDKQIAREINKKLFLENKLDLETCFLKSANFNPPAQEKQKNKFFLQHSDLIEKKFDEYLFKQCQQFYFEMDKFVYIMNFSQWLEEAMTIFPEILKLLKNQKTMAANQVHRNFQKNFRQYQHIPESLPVLKNQHKNDHHRGQYNHHRGDHRTGPMENPQKVFFSNLRYIDDPQDPKKTLKGKLCDCLDNYQKRFFYFKEMRRPSYFYHKL